VNRSLGRGVVEQALAALEAGDGAGVDDGASTRQLSHRGSRHVEIAKDVRAEGELELFVAEVLDGVNVPLVRGVVDEDVELSQLLHRLLDGLFAVLR